MRLHVANQSIDFARPLCSPPPFHFIHAERLLKEMVFFSRKETGQSYGNNVDVGSPSLYFYSFLLSASSTLCVCVCVSGPIDLIPIQLYMRRDCRQIIWSDYLCWIRAAHFHIIMALAHIYFPINLTHYDCHDNV